jgi:hypothetical protein
MHSDELAAAAAAYEEAIKAAGLDAVAVADQTKTSSLAAHKRQVLILLQLVFLFDFVPISRLTLASPADRIEQEAEVCRIAAHRKS